MTSRAYGGKLGVWLTKKNITNHDSVLDDSSSSSSSTLFSPPTTSRSEIQQQPNRQESQTATTRRKRHGYTNIGRSFSSCSTRARKAILSGGGGSFLPPSTIMNRIHRHAQRKLSSNVSKGTRNLEEMIGWDDVRCRPVYFNTEGCIGIDDLSFDPNNDVVEKIDTSDGSSSNASNNSSPPVHNKRKRTKKDESNSRIDSDTLLSDTKHDLSPRQTPTRLKEYNIFPTSKGKNKPKHSYGNLINRRKRRLVDMATSVWEQCVSPARKFYSVQYGTSSKKQGKQRKKLKSSRVLKQDSSNSTTTGRNPMENALIDFTLSKLEDDTPPPPNHAVVCFDSNRLEPNDESDKEIQTSNKKDEMFSKQTEDLNMPMFDDANNSPTKENNKEEFRPDVRLKPKACKIRVKERKDSAVCLDDNPRTMQEGRDFLVGHEKKDQRRGAPCQPTSFTALADAKAFFDYLDTTHELKIE